MTPKLFFHIFNLETRKIMSYRADFWILTAVGVAVAIVIPYFLWKAVYFESGKEVIGGRSFSAMVFYYVAVALLGKVVRGPDLAQTLARDIYEGGLSRYLVYPTGYLSFKYSQHLGQCVPGVLQLAFFGTFFLVLWEIPDGTSIDLGTACRSAVSLALANLLYFLLVYPIQAVGFWADNVWSLTVLVRFVSGLLGGHYLPLELFPPGAREILSYLPFQHLFYLPVTTLTGKVTASEWFLQVAGAAAWCGGIYVVGRLIWRRGELGYTGVGI